MQLFRPIGHPPIIGHQGCLLTTSLILQAFSVDLLQNPEFFDGLPVQVGHLNRILVTVCMKLWPLSLTNSTQPLVDAGFILSSRAALILAYEVLANSSHHSLLIPRPSVPKSNDWHDGCMYRA